MLLKKQINELNRELEPGYESLNLSSLGIPDFIGKCMSKISAFCDIKKKVEKNVMSIEGFVRSIEEA